MTTAHHTGPRPRRRFRLIAIFGALGIAALALGVAGARGPGGPFHGFHGHGHDGPAPTPDQAAEMASHVAERLADKVDADDAQRAALDKALVARSGDWLNLRLEGKALKEQAKQALLREPRPDRAELEALRKQGVALADRAAGLGIDTLLDVTDVLTDAQLAEVRDRLSWWYK